MPRLALNSWKHNPTLPRAPDSQSPEVLPTHPVPSIWLGTGESEQCPGFHGGYILAQAVDKEQDKHNNDTKK